MNVFEETIKKYIIEHGSPVELVDGKYNDPYTLKERFWHPSGVHVIFDILLLVSTRGIQCIINLYSLARRSIAYNLDWIDSIIKNSLD